MQTSALGTLGKRVLAWIIVVGAALLALKLIVSAVMGLVTLVVVLALLVAAGYAVLWAMRQL